MQSTLAVISIKKIERNTLAMQRKAKAPLIAVVKDDAYGHGAERVSSAIEPLVAGFAVATVNEGASLRIAGISKEILVLTPCLSESECLRCHAYALTPTLTSFAALRLLAESAAKYGFFLRAQLKVNTGMNRYGFRPDRVRRACWEAERSGIEISGVYSHFYAPEEKTAREEQNRLFLPASEEVKKFFPQAVRHLAATGGILAGEQYAFDAVRCGIGLYGYLPAGFENALRLEPAMKVYATAAQCGKFTGGGVCYARASERYGTLSTLRLGYGDGFSRGWDVGNVNGLCMDACVVGKEVRYGRRQLIFSDAAAYARAHGTIVYEVLIDAARKAEKVYV